MMLLVPVSVFAKDVIIGDSHVGGMLPYLSKDFVVKYKNGTTAKYWLNQNKIENVRNLFIVTGTNDGYAKVKPEVWKRQSNVICEKWKAKMCYIVAPFPNKKQTHLVYRKILENDNNVIWLPVENLRKDGVHLTNRSYKKAAEILNTIRLEVNGF